MTLRFILGDQLNSQHSWFESVDDQILYLMAEMRQETDYTTHHIQKVVGIFAAMRHFARSLEQQGHQVIYLNLDDPENQHNPTENIRKLLKTHSIESFEYLLPDEYRLDQEFQNLEKTLNIKVTACDTEHFMTTRYELKQFFEGKKQSIMEFFYRDMRKKHQILMVSDTQPEGGQWNFDKSNRKKWKGSPAIPELPQFNSDGIEAIYEMVQSSDVKTMGTLDPDRFMWPTRREQALQDLDYFCEHLLLHFGDYQDAMDPDEDFMFHSRLSFALNIKLIHPKEVVETVINYWRDHKEDILISQVEGFVRQIIGWREYMRGMYWKEMPAYENLNKLQHHQPLPEFYWTGDTKMNCLHHAISQSLELGYAHHIQRLMVTGNYALLTQTDPDEVDAWYLGIYIDAFQWVQITNTRGMSQYADGGMIATKPYISSGSYINKMSNYCKDCHYSVSKKVGEDACPFNSLYWNFLDTHRETFKSNQRMGMMMNLLSKMDPELLQQHRDRAQHIIAHPNEY